MWWSDRGPPTITSRGGVKTPHPCIQTSRMAPAILAQGAALPRERQQHQQRVPQSNDGYRHKHRQMTMTTAIKNNGHEDEGDNRDDMTLTQRLPSEHLRTQNPESGPKLHRNGGKITEKRALTNVNRHYFGADGRFSAVNQR